MTVDAREFLADLALFAEGLTAAPATLDDYLDLIVTCPADRANPQRCREAAAQSSCARTCLGIWARAGVKHPLLVEPYLNGTAVGDVVAIARDADALRGLDYEIGRADVVIIGEGNNVHVLTVLRHDDASIESSDGGQHQGVFEAIENRVRLEVDTAGARFLGGRRVQYVIDASAIAGRWGIGQ